MATNQCVKADGRRSNLAAVVPSNSDMPWGFEIETGAYVAFDRTVPIRLDDTPLSQGGVADAYEARFSLHQGMEYLHLQIIRFTSFSDVELNLAISNGSIERFQPSSTLTDLPEPLPFENATFAVLAGLSPGQADVRDPAFPIYSVAYQLAEYSVRVILTAAESVDFRLRCDDANLAAYAAVSRLNAILEGGTIAGVDFDLPKMCPRFGVEGGFEFYVQGGRYGVPPMRPADPTGFTSGYCRGVSEPQTEPTRSGRSVSGSTYIFESKSDAESIIERWLPLQRSDHWETLADDSGTRVLAVASAHSIGHWRSEAYVTFGSHLFVSGVWGWDSKSSAIKRSGQLALEWESVARTGTLPITIQDPFGDE